MRDRLSIQITAVSTGAPWVLILAAVLWYLRVYSFGFPAPKQNHETSSFSTVVRIFYSCAMLTAQTATTGELTILSCGFMYVLLVKL